MSTLAAPHPRPFTSPSNQLHPFPSRFKRRPIPITWSGLAQRLASAIAGIWGAITVVFFMLMSTGNPVLLMISPNSTPEQVAHFTHLYGFDRPILVQYVNFVTDTLCGRFPNSLRSNESPFKSIAVAIPNTLVLAGLGVTTGVLLGLVAGGLAASRAPRYLRTAALGSMMVLQALPVFVTGIIAIAVFALWLDWLPTGGSGGPIFLLLPVGTLALLVAPPVARLFRSTIHKNRDSDHAAAARAKEISSTRVYLRHVAANSLVPVVSLIGLQAGGLLGGAVLTESVFSWPGIGTLTVNAIGAKDYPVVIAAVMVIAAIFISVNFIADLAVTFLDPRAGTR